MDTDRTRLMAAALLRDREAGVGAVANALVRGRTQIDRELAPMTGTAGMMIRRSLQLGTRDRTVAAAACGGLRAGAPLLVAGPSGSGQGPAGLGIGPTVVRELVEAHHGSIGACSEGLGLGPEFVLRLPRLAADVPSEGVPC
jgi:hypothetical protein